MVREFRRRRSNASSSGFFASTRRGLGSKAEPALASPLSNISCRRMAVVFGPKASQAKGRRSSSPCRRRAPVTDEKAGDAVHKSLGGTNSGFYSSPMVHVGIGYDVHALVAGRKLILGGVD